MKDTAKGEIKTNAMTGICIATCFLSNLSYLPQLTTIGFTQLLSYPVWALLLFVSFTKKGLSTRIRGKPLLLILLAVLAIMAFFELQPHKDYFDSLLTRCFITAFLVLFIGEIVSSTGEVDGQEYKLFLSYIVSAVILCVVVFFTYLLGQDLNSSIYAYQSKNEAAFVAITAIIMLLYLDQCTERKPGKAFSVLRAIGIAFFVAIILLMRSRQMIVGIVVVLATFLFQKNSSKFMKALIVTAAISAFLALQDDGIYDTVINGIMFAGRDSSSVDSLSSGRVTQISNALNLFLQNPLTGTGDTRTVDCFFISALMQYGLFLGGIFIILGFVPLVFGVRCFTFSKSPLAMVLILCALSYLIGGLFEENAPFGPGVRCYMSWFLCGYLKAKMPANNSRKATHERD